MPTQTVLAFILSKMTQVYPINKPRRDFLVELFRVLLAMRGRVNFTNMARFSDLGEQTLRRHFGKAFDWLAFNLTLMQLSRHPEETVIGVFDCSFIAKSGKKTWGLDKFFSSAARAVRTGLEVSILGCIGVESRRVWTLDVTQTPAGLSTREQTGYSRIDFYLEQITDCLASLAQVKYYVGDGYYARGKVFDTLTQYGKQVITKLRSDANLRFLATCYQGRGRPRQYAGKVRFGHWAASGFEDQGVLDDLPHVRLYSALVHSPHFRRRLQVVALVDERDGAYVVLCSTYTEQMPAEIVAYYRLRYQLEFCIRDAKQFTGLSHCQARDEHKLDFHVNMSLAAVNLARLLCQKQGCSLNSYVRQAYNTYWVERLLSELSLEAEFDISHPRIQSIIQIGRMAA